MNEKLKLLALVFAVISSVVILSDSASSLQQIMGILIAMMILHFYLTRHFNDVIELSQDIIKEKTKKFRLDESVQQEQQEQEYGQQQQCTSVQQLDSLQGSQQIKGVTGMVKNEQQDPYFLTSDQYPQLLSQTPLNCQNVVSGTPNRKYYEHVYDLHSIEQGLSRKPVKSIVAQQKISRNKQFYDHYWKNELDREEARIWYEDSFICHPQMQQDQYPLVQ